MLFFEEHTRLLYVHIHLMRESGCNFHFNDGYPNDYSNDPGISNENLHRLPFGRSEIVSQTAITNMDVSLQSHSLTRYKLF